MVKFVTTLIVSLVAGLVIAGSATNASARHYYPGCNCGPNTPSTYYKTIHTAKSQTRYHDVSVTKRVNRIHLVTNVTRIQPIIRIHDVTRIHHHTVVETRNAYRHVTQHLTPIRYVQHSTQNFYDCRCGR